MYKYLYTHTNIHKDTLHFLADHVISELCSLQESCLCVHLQVFEESYINKNTPLQPTQSATTVPLRISNNLSSDQTPGDFPFFLKKLNHPIKYRDYFTSHGNKHPET